MTITYEILPPGREWPGDVEACAQSLVDGADGQRGALAALSLLFRDPELTIFAPAIVDGYINGIRSAWIDWRRLSWDAENRRLRGVSDQARAIVMLACSMASGACKVRLGDLLADLDESTRTAFIGAVAFLFGSES